MTPDHDIERVLDEWFAEGPTQMPSRFLTDTLDRIDRAPHRRLADLRPRLRPMNSNLRLAAAAAAVLLVAGIGLAFISRDSSVVGGPSPSPSASPSKATLSDVPLLLGTWTSDGTRQVPFRNGNHNSDGIGQVDIVLGPVDLRWDGGTVGILNTASVIGPDRLELRIGDEPTSLGLSCAIGDAGTYAFSLTPDRKLTLTPVYDACKARAAVLAGDWYHTDRDDLVAPGSHVSTLFRPFGGGTSGTFSYTVPAGWTDNWECRACFIFSGPHDETISLWANIAPASTDAQCNPVAPPTGSTLTATAAWFATLPNLVVSTPTPISIGGLDGVVIDISIVPGWKSACSYTRETTGEVGATDSPPIYNDWVQTFVGPDGSPDIKINRGGHVWYVLLDAGDGQTLVIAAEAIGPSFSDTLVTDAMPIIETFKFTR
jgi:hypothetical protein